MDHVLARAGAGAVGVGQSDLYPELLQLLARSGVGELAVGLVVGHGQLAGGGAGRCHGGSVLVHGGDLIRGQEAPVLLACLVGRHGEGGVPVAHAVVGLGPDGKVGAALPDLALVLPDHRVIDGRQGRVGLDRLQVPKDGIGGAVHREAVLADDLVPALGELGHPDGQIHLGRPHFLGHAGLGIGDRFNDGELKLQVAAGALGNGLPAAGFVIDLDIGLGLVLVDEVGVGVELGVGQAHARVGVHVVGHEGVVLGLLVGLGLLGRPQGRAKPELVARGGGHIAEHVGGKGRGHGSGTGHRLGGAGGPVVLPQVDGGQGGPGYALGLSGVVQGLHRLAGRLVPLGHPVAVQLHLTQGRGGDVGGEEDEFLHGIHAAHHGADAVPLGGDPAADVKALLIAGHGHFHGIDGLLDGEAAAVVVEGIAVAGPMAVHRHGGLPDHVGQQAVGIGELVLQVGHGHLDSGRPLAVGVQLHGIGLGRPVEQAGTGAGGRIDDRAVHRHLQVLHDEVAQSVSGGADQGEGVALAQGVAGLVLHDGIPDVDGHHGGGTAAQGHIHAGPVRGHVQSTAVDGEDGVVGEGIRRDMDAGLIGVHIGVVVHLAAGKFGGELQRAGIDARSLQGLQPGLRLHGGDAQIQADAGTGHPVDGQGVDAPVVGVAVGPDVVEVDLEAVAANGQLHVLHLLGGLGGGKAAAGHDHHGLAGNTDGGDVQVVHVVGHRDKVLPVGPVKDRGHGALADAQVIQQHGHVALIQPQDVDDVADAGTGELPVGVGAVTNDLEVVLMAHSHRHILQAALDLGVGVHIPEDQVVDAQRRGVLRQGVQAHLVHLVGHHHIVEMGVAGKDGDHVQLHRIGGVSGLGVGVQVHQDGLLVAGLLGLRVGTVDDHRIGLLGAVAVGEDDDHLVVTHHQVPQGEVHAALGGTVVDGDGVVVGHLVVDLVAVAVHHGDLASVAGIRGKLRHQLVVGAVHQQVHALHRVGHSGVIGVEVRGEVGHQRVLHGGGLRLLVDMDDGAFQDRGQAADIGRPVDGHQVTLGGDAAVRRRDLGDEGDLGGPHVQHQVQGLVALEVAPAVGVHVVVGHAHLGAGPVGVDLDHLDPVNASGSAAVGEHRDLLGPQGGRQRDAVGAVGIGQGVIEQLAVPDGRQRPASGVVHGDDVASVHVAVGGLIGAQVQLHLVGVAVGPLHGALDADAAHGDGLKAAVPAGDGDGHPVLALVQRDVVDPEAVAGDLFLQGPAAHIAHPDPVHHRAVDAGVVRPDQQVRGALVRRHVDEVLEPVGIKDGLHLLVALQLGELGHVALLVHRQGGVAAVVPVGQLKDKAVVVGGEVHVQRAQVGGGELGAHRLAGGGIRDPAGLDQVDLVAAAQQDVEHLQGEAAGSRRGGVVEVLIRRVGHSVPGHVLSVHQQALHGGRVAGDELGLVLVKVQIVGAAGVLGVVLEHLHRHMVDRSAGEAGQHVLVGHHVLRHRDIVLIHVEGHGVANAVGVHIGHGPDGQRGVHPGVHGKVIGAHRGIGVKDRREVVVVRVRLSGAGDELDVLELGGVGAGTALDDDHVAAGVQLILRGHRHQHHVGAHGQAHVVQGTAADMVGNRAVGLGDLDGGARHGGDAGEVQRLLSAVHRQSKDALSGVGVRGGRRVVVEHRIKAQAAAGAVCRRQLGQVGRAGIAVDMQLIGPHLGGLAGLVLDADVQVHVIGIHRGDVQREEVVGGEALDLAGIVVLGHQGAELDHLLLFRAAVGEGGIHTHLALHGALGHADHKGSLLSAAVRLELVGIPEGGVDVGVLLEGTGPGVHVHGEGIPVHGQDVQSVSGPGDHGGGDAVKVALLLVIHTGGGDSGTVHVALAGGLGGGVVRLAEDALDVDGVAGGHRHLRGGGDDPAPGVTLIGVAHGGGVHAHVGHGGHRAGGGTRPRGRAHVGQELHDAGGILGLGGDGVEVCPLRDVGQVGAVAQQGGVAAVHTQPIQAQIRAGTVDVEGVGQLVALLGLDHELEGVDAQIQLHRAGDLGDLGAHHLGGAVGGHSHQGDLGAGMVVDVVGDGVHIHHVGGVAHLVGIGGVAAQRGLVTHHAHLEVALAVLGDCGVVGQVVVHRVVGAGVAGEGHRQGDGDLGVIHAGIGDGDGLDPLGLLRGAAAHLDHDHFLGHSQRQIGGHIGVDLILGRMGRARQSVARDDRARGDDHGGDGGLDAALIQVGVKGLPVVVPEAVPLLLQPVLLILEPLALEGVGGVVSAGVHDHAAHRAAGGGEVEGVIQVLLIIGGRQAQHVGRHHVGVGIGAGVDGQSVDALARVHLIQVEVHVDVVDDELVLTGTHVAGDRGDHEAEQVVAVVEAAGVDRQDAVLGIEVPHVLQVALDPLPVHLVVDEEVIVGQFDPGGGLGGADLDLGPAVGVVHRGPGHHLAFGVPVEIQGLVLHLDVVQVLIQRGLEDHGLEGLGGAAHVDPDGHHGLGAGEGHLRVDGLADGTVGVIGVAGGVGGARGDRVVAGADGDGHGIAVQTVGQIGVVGRQLGLPLGHREDLLPVDGAVRQLIQVVDIRRIEPVEPARDLVGGAAVAHVIEDISVLDVAGGDVLHIVEPAVGGHGHDLVVDLHRQIVVVDLVAVDEQVIGLGVAADGGDGDLQLEHGVGPLVDDQLAGEDVAVPDGAVHHYGDAVHGDGIARAGGSVQLVGQGSGVVVAVLQVRAALDVPHLDGGVGVAGHQAEGHEEVILRLIGAAGVAARQDGDAGGVAALAGDGGALELVVDPVQVAHLHLGQRGIRGHVVEVDDVVLVDAVGRGDPDVDGLLALVVDLDARLAGGIAVGVGRTVLARALVQDADRGVGVGGLQVQPCPGGASGQLDAVRALVLGQAVHGGAQAAVAGVLVSGRPDDLQVGVAGVAQQAQLVDPVLPVGGGDLHKEGVVGHGVHHVAHGGGVHLGPCGQLQPVGLVDVDTAGGRARLHRHVGVDRAGVDGGHPVVEISELAGAAAPGGRRPLLILADVVGGGGGLGHLHGLGVVLLVVHRDEGGQVADVVLAGDEEQHHVGLVGQVVQAAGRIVPVVGAQEDGIEHGLVLAQAGHVDAGVGGGVVGILAQDHAVHLPVDIHVGAVHGGHRLEEAVAGIRQGDVDGVHRHLGGVGDLAPIVLAGRSGLAVPVEVGPPVILDDLQAAGAVHQGRAARQGDAGGQAGGIHH